MEGRDAIILLARHTRINWAQNKGSMITIDPITSTLLLSDGFEAWAMDINNWSLDRGILSELPAFADKAWIDVDDQSKDIALQRDAQFFQDDMQFFRDVVDDQVLSTNFEGN
jgi:hypothetical protein